MSANGDNEKQLQKLNAELEKKYHQLEKANKELASFMYITSHDIKEPLKHVYTSLELLVKKEGHSLSNMSKGNLRRMQSSLNKMNLLLDDILTVSSINSNDEILQQVNLNDILTDATERLKHKIEETKALIESQPLPVILGYPKMLQHLFVNLIDNAIKFQAENAIPMVKIAVEDLSGKEIRISELSSNTDYIKISFIDNGIGFDGSDAERIFKLFERLHDRKYHGSGIGLTICKKIVEAHDGCILASGKENSGSTFEIYLPSDKY